MKQTLVSQLAKWKSSELAKDLAITDPPSPVYTSDDHSFPFPFSHASAISKTPQRASATTRGENSFPSSSSSRSQQNKPVAPSAGGSAPSSRRKIFLPCWLIQWVTPPPFHFLPLHSSPLPCYPPPLLFLLTILLSQFTFFLGMKSFPTVLPDSCPHEDMETRMPSHSWLDLSSRGGTHALAASILTADIFLLAGKIHPFLYSTGFVTSPQSLSFSKINFRFVWHLRKKNHKTKRTKPTKKPQWFLPGRINQAACHLFIPLHWFQTDVYKN